MKEAVFIPRRSTTPSDKEAYAFVAIDCIVAIEVYTDTHSFCIRTTLGDRYHGETNSLRRVLTELGWDESNGAIEMIERLRL